jgi:hypothetical protein
MMRLTSFSARRYKDYHAYRSDAFKPLENFKNGITGMRIILLRIDRVIW